MIDIGNVRAKMIYEERGTHYALSIVKTIILQNSDKNFTDLTKYRLAKKQTFIQFNSNIFSSDIFSAGIKFKF
jgi:hypothetical protein